MRFVRNFFAIVGLITVLALGYGAVRFGPALSQFDPDSARVYGELGARLLETGDPGVALMWSAPVQDDLTVDDVIDSLKSLAVSHDLLFVGESPFYKQIEAISGEKYRYVNFLSFCNARIGRLMLEYRNEYSGFMPCRIALVEGADGKLRLYSANLDLLIYGGRALPDELKQATLKTRDAIKAIMQGAAAGEF